jgi:hypothetical protein
MLTLPLQQPQQQGFGDPTHSPQQQALLLLLPPQSRTHHPHKPTLGALVLQTLGSLLHPHMDLTPQHMPVVLLPQLLLVMGC